MWQKPNGEAVGCGPALSGFDSHLSPHRGGMMKEEEDVGEVVIHSSIGQFKDFIESSVWADIKRELGVWLEDVRNISEDPKVEDKERLISVGRIDALKYFKGLPENMLESLIATIENPVEDKEDQPKELEDIL
jgi:hypothetical protein